MKTKIIILLSALLFNSCIAQIQIPEDAITITEYPAFYAQTVQKMNNIIPNKTQYYGKPLSAFLSALRQNNLIVKEYNPAPFNDNKLLIFSFLWNRFIDKPRMDKDYVKPYIYIYVQQPFDFQQASTMMSTNGYHSYWNPQAENFFKDQIIEKIVFKYVGGLTNKHAADK